MSELFSLNRVAGQLGRAGELAVSATLVAVPAGRAVAATRVLKQGAAGAAQRARLAGRDLAGTVQTVAADPLRARARGRELVLGAGETLKQLRSAVDHREVAGGLAGLTAGEVMGGAIGGAAGVFVAGPAGAIVGAEVGAFAAGMLGMKLGTDAVRDFVGTTPDGAIVAPVGGAAQAEEAILKRQSSERLGGVIGLTSGASVGRVVAGRPGGWIGAAIGEAVARQAGGGPAKAASGSAGPVQAGPGKNPALWLNRFGKNTAGEAATILLAGSIGSIFGPGGRSVGQRLGLIVGRQIAWDNLVGPTTETAAVGSPAPLATAIDQAAAPEPGAPDVRSSLAGPAPVSASDPVSPNGDLGNRDMEVLSLLAASMRNRQIAAQLATLPAMASSTGGKSPIRQNHPAVTGGNNDT